MAKKQEMVLDYAFFNILQGYYAENKGKIKRNYTDLTRKFLNYNDKSINPNAYLRKPQFEALEMYVFIKEFLNNRQVSTIFEDYMEKRGSFADTSFYITQTARSGQMSFAQIGAEQNKYLFKKMKKVSEAYPNYIYALTMGLGKTILIATCIFYEFLVANKNTKDNRFCHNALVFAPDKTVLESLREIVTFDKTLVVPPEYARVLDANIKVHFLDEAGTTLNTLDNSDFNIIISNTQKIIVKKKSKLPTPTEKLYSMGNTDTSSIMSEALADIYGDDDITADDLIFNQRFKKLCRLSQIGVYVDEAHHLFGKDLEKALHNKATDTSLRSTINVLAAELERNGTSVVACYNYTGTPYVNNEILPEVVYSYGLNDAIINKYLKDAIPVGYENVKNEEFLRDVIKRFWTDYNGKTFEGLTPKIAIFGSKVAEVQDEIKPAVEKILSELGIPLTKILVNVGDTTITKADDIRDFNNLDRVGTVGNEKQFILLVDKGREGWNCRSLFGVAMFRNPSSKVFILQATMRCLRQITDEQQNALVFLSKENMDTLNDELHQNFNMSIEDFGKSNATKRQSYEVRMVPPPKYIKLKSIRHNYLLVSKEYSSPVDFNLANTDLSKYEALVYEKSRLTSETSVKVRNIDDIRDNIKYSPFMLVCEIAKYLNLKCSLISRILNESIDGIDTVISSVSKYNDVLYDIIIPKIFDILFTVSVTKETKEKDVVLLREPKDKDFYSFKGLPELVICKTDASMIQYQNRSFHADTYVFDSKPEKECFLQYIENIDKVKRVYFTGMFTSQQGDLSIPYYDPDSKRMRNYFPDFLAEMVDGSFQLIEVKGDNKIDDIVVKAKARAAEEIASESQMEYKIYAGSELMSKNVIDTVDTN